MNSTTESKNQEEQRAIWFVVGTDFYVTVGILANLLVLRVLWQRKMRNNSFNTLRGALALFDMLLFIAALMHSVLKWSEGQYSNDCC